MRAFLLTMVSGLVLTCCALLAGSKPEEKVAIRLRLIDSETQQPIGGIIRIHEEGQEAPLELPGLLNRLEGLGKKMAMGWYVVPATGAETMLPRHKVRLEAVAGLETTLARQDLDLSASSPRQATIEIPFLFRAEKLGLTAGNTHLHLRNMTLDHADHYLKVIPPADQLKVLFVSYLERFKDDRDYISNKYPIGEMPRLKGTGVLYNNGEEHRHNFEGFGAGYGHVMLLNIKDLVRPVSIGPGITGGGFDDLPLRPGIANARKQGGTILWCHNTNGYEFLPSLLAGKLDALNVFDGSRTGKYEDRYYRCLNIGLHLPISTGTDWFMYDWSRVYVGVKGPLTIPSWLEGLREGRAIATNGPLLRLKVNGQEVGSSLRLPKSGPVQIEAEAVGRHDFQKLQLIQNGAVIATIPARQQAGGYVARLTKEMVITEPVWLATRIESNTRNEFDLPLYAHTSPIYIDLEGRGVFQIEAARELLRELEEGQAVIRMKGKFTANPARDAILASYDEAMKTLRERIAKRGS